MQGCPHFDLMNPDTYRGGLPRAVYRYLRREAPVYWHEDPQQGVGFWVVTRQAELDYVSKNPDLFSSAERSCLLHEMPEDQLAMVRTQLINMDPPQHIKYRRLVRAAFTNEEDILRLAGDWSNAPCRAGAASSSRISPWTCR